MAASLLLYANPLFVNVHGVRTSAAAFKLCKLQLQPLRTCNESALQLVRPSAAQSARGSLWVSLYALEAKCASGKGLMLAAPCLRLSHRVVADISRSARRRRAGVATA